MTANSRQTPKRTATATTMTMAKTTAATASAPERLVAGADLNPADPTVDRCNVTYCAVIRLTKGMLVAAITAGTELAAAQRELGDQFSTFITTRTPWTVAEARAMIRFAAQAGLQPDRLTAAHDVPLERLLRAVSLVGRLYEEKLAQDDDHSHTH